MKSRFGPYEGDFGYIARVVDSDWGCTNWRHTNPYPITINGVTYPRGDLFILTDREDSSRYVLLNGAKAEGPSVNMIKGHWQVDEPQHLANLVEECSNASV